jgi:hypothetical protein
VTAAAQQPGWVEDRQELQGIDDQVQTLKKEVIEINNELLLLEEKLLFPSTTHLSVFVSLEAEPGFRLDSVELKVDGQVVAQYIYTFRELEALLNGGVQRLHTGNLPTGNHRIAAVIRGKTPGGDPFEQTGDVAIDKDVDPKFVEMQIIAAGGPRIAFRDW